MAVEQVERILGEFTLGKKHYTVQLKGRGSSFNLMLVTAKGKVLGFYGTGLENLAKAIVDLTTNELASASEEDQDVASEALQDVIRIMENLRQDRERQVNQIMEQLEKLQTEFVSLP